MYILSTKMHVHGLSIHAHSSNYGDFPQLHCLFFQFFQHFPFVYFPQTRLQNHLTWKERRIEGKDVVFWEPKYILQVTMTIYLLTTENVAVVFSRNPHPNAADQVWAVLHKLQSPRAAKPVHIPHAHAEEARSVRELALQAGR